jgi:outer membrane protein assembly factor BamB
MHCQDVTTDLELYVLGDFPAKRQCAIEAHLRDCPSCREAERECRGIVSQIRDTTGRSDVRPAFRDQVHHITEAAIRAERGRIRRRRFLAAAGAVAAVLVLAVAAWLAVRPSVSASRRVVQAAERWRYQHVRAVPASPADGMVVQDGTVYLVRSDDRGGHVAAVDGATGIPSWESSCNSIGYLAADHERVYCLVSQRRDSLALVALDAAEGDVLWLYEQPQGQPWLQPSRPVPVEGQRVCWSASEAVHMLDARTGKPLWSRSATSDGPFSAPVISRGGICVASRSGLQCLSVADGSSLWEHGFEKAASHGRPLLALAGRKAYIARSRLRHTCDLLCLDMKSHSVAWRRNAPQARSLLAADGVLCLRQGSILAVDCDTGESLWRHRASGCGPLTHIGGLVHFVDTTESGRLVALQPKTGRSAWELPGIHSCDAFARMGHLGVIKTREGVVLALALSRPGRF